MSDVMERLRDANPVPRDLSTGWSRTDEGRETRDGSTRFEPRHRRRLPAAVVAAVLVVALAASVALLRGGAGDERTPVSGSTTDRLANGEWEPLPHLPAGLTGAVTPIWTGRRLIVWGAESGAELVDGRWRALPAWGFGNRYGALVRWTGKEMLVWGGLDPVVSANVVWGAAYEPRTRSWRALPSSPVPQGPDSTATWTGHVLVVTSGVPSGPPGATYDPDGDRWTTVPAASPTPQANATTRAAWDGRRVLFTMLTGTRAEAITYDPRADRWAGSPPMTATAYGPNDLFPSSPWVVQVLWREESGRPGYLEVARRRYGGGGSDEHAHPSICAVRTTPVPGGAAISCSTQELLAVDARTWSLRALPRPPTPVGAFVWAGSSLVAISDGGRVVELTR